MDIETQLKSIVDETVVVEEEVEVSWIVEQEKLSDDEKLWKLKELAHYAQSDEFKSIITKFKEKVTEVQKEIRKIAFSREEAKVVKSILDEYVVAYNATQEILDETTCETYKNYLLSRLEALESAILKKRGVVEKWDMAFHFDMPIYTEIDILKEKATVYNSVDQFMKYCISIYDFKGIMERKNGKEEERPHEVY